MDNFHEVKPSLNVIYVPNCHFIVFFTNVPNIDNSEIMNKLNIYSFDLMKSYWIHQRIVMAQHSEKNTEKYWPSESMQTLFGKLNKETLQFSIYEFCVI